MKIAYIFTLFPQYSETFAGLDVREMSKLNSDTSVFTLRRPTREQINLLHERGLSKENLYIPSLLDYLLVMFNIGMIRFLIITIWKNEKVSKNRIKCLLYIPSAIVAYKKINTLAFDVVHLFWGHTPSLCGLLIKRYSPNIKLTMFLGAYDLHQKLGITKLLLSDVDRVFTHCKANVPSIRELKPHVHPIVIYRGIDTMLKNYNVHSPKIYNRWGVASRLIRSKNVDKAIILFNQICRDNADACLWIFGDGPEKQNLLDLCIKLGIEERVSFYGHKEQKSMLELMSTCEVSLLLSTKVGECLPNSIKEAMCLGCKVVVARTIGIEELIPDGTYGYVIESECINLNSTLLIRDHLDKIDIIKSADFIKDKFSAQNSASQYYKEWKSISE